MLNKFKESIVKAGSPYFFYNKRDDTLHWGAPKQIALLKEVYDFKAPTSADPDISAEEFLRMTEEEYRETLWQKNNKEVNND